MKGQDVSYSSIAAFINCTSNSLSEVDFVSGFSVWTRQLLLVMESQSCHPRVSRRMLRRCELTNVGLFMDVSESFMINCIKCGRQCFHTLGNLHHALPLHWFCPFDLSNGFGISSAACLPGALHCVNIIYEVGNKAYASYSRRENTNYNVAW